MYVVVDDHKSGDFAPYVLKSENRGRSWRSIVGNLPDRHLLWRIVQDHVNPQLMFLGTEFGVFFTVNGGGAWTKLAGATPNIAFRDLVIQTRENDLVGATFGRSFFVLDDYSPLRDVSQSMLENDTVLFPVRRAHWYVPRRPHACSTPGCVDSQGDAYYVAPNPDFGAMFTYYLPESLQSGKDARRKAEKELEGDNEDVTFASWEDLDAERLEDAPAIVFRVADMDGNVIRYLEGPADAGFHRLNWDLRYPALHPFVPEDEREDDDSRAGVLVAPGTYQVSMHSRIDGVLTDLGQTQTFEAVSIREPTLEGTSQDERIAFTRQVDELNRAVRGTLEAIDEVVADLQAAQDVLGRSTAEAALYDRANGLRQALLQQRDRLAGDSVRGSFAASRPMPVTARINAANFSSHWNAHGPTATHQQTLQVARNEYSAVRSTLTQLVDRDYEVPSRTL